MYLELVAVAFRLQIICGWFCSAAHSVLRPYTAPVWVSEFGTFSDCHKDGIVDAEHSECSCSKGTSISTIVITRSNIDMTDPNKGRSKRVDLRAAILITSNNDHKDINSIISLGRPTLTTIFAFKSPAIHGDGGSFIWISHS